MSGFSGRGESTGHAGEILQGALRRDTTAEPFLITLPAPCLRSVATIEPAPEWSIEPRWRTKALRAGQLAALRWDWRYGAAIGVESHIPVARGFGSSTADCVAVVRALADLLGRTCTAAEIARIVQQAEGASDSTMFGIAPMAFLPERGECLLRMPNGWPALHITAWDTGGPPTLTTECPRPAYTSAELDEFAELLTAVTAAFQAGDAVALGRCATRSATIQQRYAPHDHWSELLVLLESTRAFGIAISHTGTVAALLSDHFFPIAGSLTYELSGTTQPL